MKDDFYNNIRQGRIVRPKRTELEKYSAGGAKQLCSRIASSLISLCSPLLLLTSLAACSRQSSADEVAKELKTVESWTATAETVGDAWIRGNVPVAYAKQTLTKAQEELHKEADKLGKNAAAKASTDMQEQLKLLEDTVGKMSAAVEKKDSQAMIQQIQQLSTQEQRISKLAQATGGK